MAVNHQAATASESPNTMYTGDPHSQDLSIYRTRAQNMLIPILGHELATALENAIHFECHERASVDNLAIDSFVFTAMYVNKARQIKDNLSPDSYLQNNDLLKQLLNQNISTEQLVRMTPQQMFPKRWEKLIEAKKRRDEIQYNTTSQAMTDSYTCRKCGSKKIRYYELQIRSADEGFTTFYTCLGCGSKWKKN